MNKKNILSRLEIFIVTYNRADSLYHTLVQLLNKKSPVSNLKITILDNNSTDHTSDIIKLFIKKNKNIQYIKRNRNVGANANVAMAYELAKKDYVWVLCDDDMYNFNSWPEVVQAIENDQDMILVSKYALQMYDMPHFLSQSTFVPAVILKTEILTDTVLRNIYDNIYTMYPQLVPIVACINQNKKFYLIKGEPIVINGNDYGKKISICATCDNYTRGANKKEMYYRSATMSQLVGYSNVISLLYDKKLKTQITKKWEYKILPLLNKHEDWIHFMDVFVNLTQKQMYKVPFIFLNYKHKTILQWIFSIKGEKTQEGKIKIITCLGMKYPIKRKK